MLQLIADASANGTPTLAESRRGFNPFPVVGYTWFQDDFGAPRDFPSYHPHGGTDIFAVSGTPVIACADGLIQQTTGGIGGNGVVLHTANGGYFYYGHLRGWAPGIVTGVHVRSGDLIGYVGQTGDAVHTYPHVHFEVHPTGLHDVRVSPKPILDAWLTAAENRLLAVLGYKVPALTGSMGWDEVSVMLAGSSSPPPALWTTAFDGTATIATADLLLGDLLATQEWDVGPAIDTAAPGDVFASTGFLDPSAIAQD